MLHAQDLQGGEDCVPLIPARPGQARRAEARSEIHPGTGRNDTTGADQTGQRIHRMPDLLLARPLRPKRDRLPQRHHRLGRQPHRA